MTREKVEVEVSNILSLVSCAEDYGFDDAVFLEAMAGMLGYECSDEEIGEAANDLGEEYGDDDRDEVRRVLTEWRARYCKGYSK